MENGLKGAKLGSVGPMRGGCHYNPEVDDRCLSQDRDRTGVD